MKITVYYEDKYDRTEIEVPDEDCEIWVETDYQQRLAVAEDKSSVTRRTPQEIRDAECNRPTYNSHQTETRRHVSIDALDPQGDTLPGAADVETDLFDEDYAELYRSISKLRPQQRELLRKVFWEDMRQIEVARAEGVPGHVIDARMYRIYESLKKKLRSEKVFPKNP